MISMLLEDRQLKICTMVLLDQSADSQVGSQWTSHQGRMILEGVLRLRCLIQPTCRLVRWLGVTWNSHLFAYLTVFLSVELTSSSLRLFFQDTHWGQPVFHLLSAIPCQPDHSFGWYHGDDAYKGMCMWLLPRSIGFILPRLSLGACGNFFCIGVFLLE